MVDLLTPKPSAMALEQMFQQAMAQHQRGNLGEAERLYQQILATEPKPSFAPRHLLGLIRAQQGRHDEALDLIGGALKINSSVPEALSNYGNVLKALGRFEEALASYDKALAFKPFDAVVLNNRGLTLLSLNRAPDAVASYDKALAVKSDYLQALYNRANALRAMGRFADALAGFEKALALQPDLAIALNNRGLTLHDMGRFEEALASFDRALTHKPDFAEAFNNRGNTLLDLKRSEEVLASFDRALAIQPAYVEALVNRGCVLKETERHDEAIAAFRRAVAIQPDFADAHFHLGASLADHGQIAEGFSHFMRRAELVYGTGNPPVETAAPVYRAKHDCEQRDYLAGGKAPDDAPPVAALFRIADGGRLAGPAVNPANATPENFHTWNTASPRVLVLDNFLTPEALAKLRNYCAGSTVWRRNYDVGSYVSATPQDGFACPLLAQIAEEIRDTYAPIIGAHLFHYLGAFKYDSALCTGTNIHADYAVVNVNFYIAPDDANLDPDSGGLIVWDRAAPADWSFAKYNGDMAANREYLASTGAKSRTVPHRANRAVIFDSALLHETDKFSFREGYLNRRTNVTLLYGRR